MPIYEYLCPDHLRFELILPMSESEATHKPCPKCGRPGQRAASLTSMQPDKYWAGEMTPQGYVTSGKVLRQMQKERNIETIVTRADAEAMKKTAADARKEWDKQIARDTRRVFDEHFTGTGIVDSFGELRPEATQPL